RCMAVRCSGAASRLSGALSAACCFPDSAAFMCARPGAALFSRRRRPNVYAKGLVADSADMPLAVTIVVILHHIAHGVAGGVAHAIAVGASVATQPGHALIELRAQILRGGADAGPQLQIVFVM